MKESLAADVILIASPDDSVAGKLKSELSKRGCDVLQLDGMSAARLFTIRASHGRSTVTPAVPMFVRQSAWQPIHPEDDDADERFLRTEAYATVWAATALSEKPVINRPAPNGHVGRLTCGTISAAGRSAFTAETHASGSHMFDHADDALWGENSSFNAAPVALLRPDIPLRARRIHEDALYEIVTVVGDNALPATVDPRTIYMKLCEKSVEIAKSVGVHFASITWSIQGPDATPVRLNAAPDEAELRYNWSAIAEALCKDLQT